MLGGTTTCAAAVVTAAKATRAMAQKDEMILCMLSSKGALPYLEEGT
jgi:hypothetical protein